MRDFAVQSIAESAPQKKHAGDARRVRPTHEPAPGGALPQSKAGCACGGGCPRCAAQVPAQAKLAVSEPGDTHEREADRVADAVVRTAGPFGPTRATADAPPQASPQAVGQLAFSNVGAKVQRQPAGRGGTTSPAPFPTPQVATWKDIWPDFDFAVKSNPGAATGIAKRLAEAPRDTDDLLKQGPEVIRWLQNHGEPAIAARLLDSLRFSFITTWAAEKNLPALGIGSGLYSAQNVFIELGKDAARAGKHDDAFKFFGTAHEILSLYADQTSQRRHAADLSRAEAYFSLEHVFSRMREIYGFYYELERDALFGGDKARAALMRAKAAELFKVLQQSFTLSGSEVELVESDPVTTTRGPALRLVGANDVTTDLTALPDLTSPREIGQGARREKLENVQAALSAQAGLQAEIRREPDALKAFGSMALDLNDTKQRQEVWRVMYGAFKKGGPGALGSLMALVGKYLKAYTLHTSYNIRDFGASYLESQFPTDLAGRVQMDCGVYALTVAWDVYQTVKQGDPKMRVDFRLVAFLDHVALIIDDRSTGESYIVHNDNITRLNQAFPAMESHLRPFFRRPHSQAGFDQPEFIVDWVEPEKEAEKQYAAMRGFSHLITPSFYYDLGSTKDTPEKFRGGAWTQYIKAVSDIADKQAALTEDFRRRTGRPISTFGLQRQFSHDAGALDGLMDKLAPSADDPQKLAAGLGDLTPLAVNALVMFERLLKGFAPLSEQRRFAYSAPGPIHPLVRVALGLLRLKKLGGTPTADQEKYLKFCEAMFKREMAEHRERGEAGRF